MNQYIGLLTSLALSGIWTETNVKFKYFLQGESRRCGYISRHDDGIGDGGKRTNILEVL